MKAKKLIGVVAGAALTMSTVFGSAMPVFADVVDTPAAETSEQSAEPSAEPTVTEPTQTEGEQTVQPQIETPVQPQIETPVQTEPVIEQQPEDPAAGATDNGIGDASQGEDTQGEEQGAQDDGATDNQESTEMQQSSAENNASGSASDGLSSDILTPLSDDEGQAGISAGSLEESQSADATLQAYTPITLDGDFSDWEGHQTTSVNDGKLSAMDMVWSEDGGLCIYLQEADGCWGAVAAGVGHFNDGRYVITTDTGRQTVFFLKADENTGECWLQDGNGNKFTEVEMVYIPGYGEYITETRQMVHYGGKYEIKIPDSMIKSYNQSVSLGYYLTEGMEQIVQNVANPYLETSVDEASVGEIVFDGNVGDWDHVTGQELVQYSTNKADAEAKLLTDDKTNMLNVFVQAYKDGMYQKCFEYFDLAVNGRTDQPIGFLLLASGEDGKLYPINNLNDGTPGTYTYYIGGVGAQCPKANEIWGFGNGVDPNTTDIHTPILGKMYFTVDATGKVTTESQIDLEKISYYMGISTDNLKKVDMRWRVIGDNWISCAGTSSGPIPGILMGAGIAVFAAWGYKKKEKGGVSAQG